MDKSFPLTHVLSQAPPSSSPFETLATHISSIDYTTHFVFPNPSAYRIAVHFYVCNESLYPLVLCFQELFKIYPSFLNLLTLQSFTQDDLSASCAPHNVHPAVQCACQIVISSQLSFPLCLSFTESIIKVYANFPN